MQLVTEVAREQTLQRVLAPAIADYDFILIDCQPSLGLLTVNALTAADGVIVPLECEYFALRGVALLIETIEKVRERLNPELEIDGVLGTMYDARTLHSREVMERLVQAFGDKVFHTVDRAHREVPRDHGRRRADHDVRVRPRAAPRPTGSWPRRCSPGARARERVAGRRAAAERRPTRRPTAPGAQDAGCRPTGSRGDVRPGAARREDHRLRHRRRAARPRARPAGAARASTACRRPRAGWSARRSP